jgi:hypothetical protein
MDMDPTDDRPTYPAAPTTDAPVRDRLTVIAILLLLQVIGTAWLVYDLAIEG